MAAINKHPEARTTERMVTFEITTAHPLPVGQQVFIAGNLEMFGAWRPDGFPLTRLDDNLWSGYAVIAEGAAVEFKITRGSWSTEEADADGAPRREHHSLGAKGPVAFRYTVTRWIDRP
ncbi:MAG TPA: CBM20 domain-containing protein [Kiritimatiellia bacterium]|nr:CBM20 domain-containing protein [Kiritimatiellia bacterium]HMO98190.1 CBM20 domain-containing protein [Kiritimatiellia bacterium]HMP96492.1 CBM20 domain-containing protein [Kiritimatiellia bacterium]